MRVKHRDQGDGAKGSVATDKWATTRMLLREDGFGLTVSDVRVPAGSEGVYGYKHHVEVCYCIEGEAELEELASGVLHRIRPGSLWAAEKGERLRLAVKTDFRVIAVFVPALVGPETSDAEGSFPLLP